jgi:hypothetical protein
MIRRGEGHFWSAVVVVATLLIAALALVSCDRPPRPIVFDPQPQDDALDEAIDRARAMWIVAGIVPPNVSVVVGDPPLGAAGYCWRGRFPLIVIRYRRADVIAHEIGHCALGLRHVDGDLEIMSGTLYGGERIGPATLAEARRAGWLP